MPLRQHSHDKCRSKVCVFCCERAKRSINRSEWLLRGVGNEVAQNQGQRGFILTVELYLIMVSIIP